MKRIDWPLWVLCLVLCIASAVAFGLGLLWRAAIPDETTQAKAMAAQAMATAFDLIKEPSKAAVVQSFSVPRPFSHAGDVVGFTIQPLESATYLVRSNDQNILMLLQQQADGTAKQCLMHPPGIQAGICQMGSNVTKK